MHSVKEQKIYDYIISGAGCAGLSLLLRLFQEPELQHVEILIIDVEDKDSNDHTWCYWEDGYGFFDHLTHKTWDKLIFKTPDMEKVLEIEPYSYKMVRSIDLYHYVKSMLHSRTNINWVHEPIQAIGNEGKLGFAVAGNTKYYGKYVFNSIIFPEVKLALEKSTCFKLLQHFKGWVIETKEPTFQPDQAHFMDFRVSQDAGTTFVYVLPITDRKALVEYTFFNEDILQANEYDSLIKAYLINYWKLTNYIITETELGVIPMTNFNFSSGKGKIINIGTAGGWTKPSSGFTFQFIQKNTAAMVAALRKGKSPRIKKTLWEKRFLIYDATLLNVLQRNKMEGRTIFSKLFEKLPPQTILRFLDDETTLKEEIQILRTMPTNIFLPAALQEIGSALLRTFGLKR